MKSENGQDCDIGGRVMENQLLKHYEDEKRKAIENCTCCGLCVKKCPIIPKTNLKEASPKEIQEKCIAFLQDGTPNDDVFTKVYACMECFKCMEGVCPKGLKPMRINEIIKWEYRLKNDKNEDYNHPQSKNALQRIIGSIQVSQEEYQKITTSSPHKKAKYVFFPGCNVYFQPEKILDALDIMDHMTTDYAFVAGLDHCCGDVHLFYGAIEERAKAMGNLIKKVSSYQPETLVLWCPTCRCRFQELRSYFAELPFNIVFFPQFVAEHIENLPMKDRIYRDVTLHEPCKTAYMGLDSPGVREIIHRIPGLRLKEMPRHGKETVCCGSGAISYFPESFDAVRAERLLEAQDTNAEILIDVCHFCHEVFVAEEKKYDFTILNYVSLLAEAIGIHREDKFKKYKQWQDVDQIMEDAEEYILQSPYSREEIREALGKTI